MRVLVTGGCGFIGMHLVKRLLREEHDVAILDSMHTGSSAKGLGCAVFQHTVTNYDACKRAMQGVHVVYHLAARCDWSDAPQHPARVVNTNTRGTAEVLTAARAVGVPRVVFASSAAVYGDVIPGEEGGWCSPVSVYGASKLAAEEICRGFVVLGLDVTVLRLFNVWGPGGSGVVEKFRDGAIVIDGNGQQTRDFVHVDDVVDAFIKAYRWEAGVYNVGTGVETSILSLWTMMHPNGLEPQFGSSRPQDVFRSVADTSKVSAFWKPQHPIEEAVK